MTLTAELVLEPRPDGEHGVSFTIRNDGPQAAELTWFEPFVAFELEAEIGGEPVRVLAGPYDGGVQPMHDVLAPSEERTIATPVTLAFDEGPALPNPGPPTRWRIAHEPAPTVLRATVTVGPHRLTCTAELHPAPLRRG